MLEVFLAEKLLDPICPVERMDWREHRRKQEAMEAGLAARRTSQGPPSSLEGLPWGQEREGGWSPPPMSAPTSGQAVFQAGEHGEWTGPFLEELLFGVVVGDGAAADRQRMNMPKDFTCSQVL